MISLIAAVARDRVIGAKNSLPWRLPEDLKYFKHVTQGHPVVMGRKTYESIGHLLPGRENRIVTRQQGYAVPGAVIFTSVREACVGEGEIFVIGGAEIYTQALPFADRLYLTEIDSAFEGDTYFPPYASSNFREITRDQHGPDLSKDRKFGFSFVVWERVCPPSGKTE